MNVNDTEIAWSILQKKGYQRTAHLSEADVVLLVTCSVREKAEQTIWNRLQQLTAMKRKRLKTHTPMKIGILGCMAERLKIELLEREKLVDVLAGPDAYRDLPRLLTGVKEVTLLGQNVNSYRDTSDEQVCGSDATKLSRGFKTVYQTKRGGLRFSDLLDQVSRFASDCGAREHL
nr:PREDICTED: CDK5 regulatory subunit-associated protein 1-like [Pundamilia nyererei]